MSREKTGLSRATQLALLLLALSPGWYLLARYAFGSSGSFLESPYFMECLECGLEYPCGSAGIAGLRCPRCPGLEGAMLFRERSGTAGWDLLVKLLIGIIAFLAVLVLVLGGHQRKRIVKQSGQAFPGAGNADEIKNPAEIRREFKEELKGWVRDLLEDRRKRHS